MRVNAQLSPEAVLAELGQRVERRRLGLGMTQAEAAKRSGLGKRTVERIEAGGDTQVSSLVRLLGVLDLMDGVDRLVPEAGPSPIELLKLKGRQRKRASSKKEHGTGRAWRWGDER